MILLAVAALMISIIYYKRSSSLHIFTYYIAFSLLQSMADCYFYTSTADEHLRRAVLMIASNSFMLFEFIVFNYFILHNINSRKRRRIVRMNGLLFVGVLIFVVSRTYRHILEGSYFLLESVFLVLPCLIYFYDLFITVSLRPLRDQPSFWIITGILFLNACSIPLLLTLGFLGNYREAAFTLNYILYIVLFILLIRAYLCTPEKLTNAPAVSG
jgi:hypothetical protein